MKYMGSKRALLTNGLGHVVVDEAKRAARFVDLFSGTGAVAWHVAERVATEVVAVDIQTYAAVLGGAVIERTRQLNPARLTATWLEPAERAAHELAAEVGAKPLGARPLEVRDVIRSRSLVARGSGGVVWRAYGGHYFSPFQALHFDALLHALPQRPEDRTSCLAALIWAATRCAASPGHTAQPFQPTSTSISHIEAAWRKDVTRVASEALTEISQRYALRRGRARVADALDVVTELGPDDLVFLDPPYSSAQYSRFYHVLETLARGGCGPVTGAGRYPPSDERPLSVFSQRRHAPEALAGLLDNLGARRCNVVLTFPQHEGSNGIIGEDVVRSARSWFHVDVRQVASRFSTLGGNNRIRASRRRSAELVLVMRPKRSRGRRPAARLS